MKQEHISKNEIDVLWVLLKEYKKLIAGMALLGLLLSVVYTLTLYKPIYKSLALMQIGKLNGVLIEPTKQMNIKLSTQYSDMHGAFPKITRVKLYDATTGLIKLEAVGYSEVSLEDYLKGIIEKVSKEHSVTHKKYVDNRIQTFTHFSDMVEGYKEDIKGLKVDIKADNKKLKSFTNNDQTMINMYTLKLLRDDTILHETEKKLIAANSSMIAHRSMLLANKTFNTKLLDKIKLLSTLVNAKKSVIITSGLLGGLLFGILIAFFFSIVNKRKKMNKDTE